MTNEQIPSAGEPESSGITRLTTEHGSRILAYGELHAYKRTPGPLAPQRYGDDERLRYTDIGPVDIHTRATVVSASQIVGSSRTMSAGEPTPPSEDPRNDLDPRRLTHRPDHDSSYSPYAVQTLSTVRRIGVIGDLHGDLEHALQAFRTFADRGVSCIIQLGGWGVLWPGSNWQVDLRKISRALARHRMAMFVVEGNHDWLPKILEYPVDADGIRWITANIGHLPRGYRTQIGGRFTLATLGGANSIDRRFRQKGVTWWPEEQISDADLHRLGNERADVLVGHEAPLMDEADQDRRALELGFSPEDAAYAAASRVMFRRAVLQTRPKLTLGGHYHRFYDQTLTLPGATAHQTRVVVLDMNGKDRVSLAILNTSTLELEFLYRNGAPAEPETNAPERTDNGRPWS